MRTGRVAPKLLLSALLAACNTVPPASDAIVIRHEILGGNLTVESLQVAPGVVAGFDRDLIVESEGDILILGKLQGLPGDPARVELRGADLVLRSRTRIVIAGEILGAPGLDGREPGQAGGRGGHVVLDAPEIVIERVEAGAAGHGAVGGDGGAGGTLYQRVGFAFREGSPGGFGGRAGEAGLASRDVRDGRGANGGAGGSAGMWPPPVALR